MFCTSCGAQNDPGAQFCIKCGTPLGQAHPSVPAEEHPAVTPPPPPAGADPLYTPPGPPYTPGQGPAFVPPPPNPGYVPPPIGDPLAKSKLAAGLLGIFLGWLGIHRFYLGYNNIAIAQLAVGLIGLFLSPFTCGLILLAASIWGIIDGVMILTGSINVDGQGRPLKD